MTTSLDVTLFRMAQQVIRWLRLTVRIRWRQFVEVDEDHTEADEDQVYIGEVMNSKQELHDDFEDVMEPKIHDV